MHKKNVWILYTVVLTVALLACNTVEAPPHAYTPSPTATLTSTPIEQTATITITPTMSAIGITNFINIASRSVNNCNAPCFLGITPDITPMENFESILGEYLDYPCSNPFRDDDVMIMYECSLSQYDSYLHIASNSYVVPVTWLSYSPSFDSPIYLESIIEYYGNPDSMSVVGTPDEREIYAVSLYYASPQIMINLEEVKHITKATKVKYITFLGKNEYAKETISARIPWEGYRELP